MIWCVYSRPFCQKLLSAAILASTSWSYAQTAKKSGSTTQTDWPTKSLSDESLGTTEPNTSADLLRHYQAGSFNEIHFESKKPFRFRIGDNIFSIPENFFARPPRIGNLSGVELRVTYPDLKPYTRDTQHCFQPSNSGPVYDECTTIEFYIDPQAPTGKEIFSRAMANAHSQARLLEIGGYSFQVLHQGPIGEGLDYYKLRDSEDAVVVDCVNFPGMGGKEGVCDDTFPLLDSVTVRFRIYKSLLPQVVHIQHGLASLARSFVQSGVDHEAHPK